MPSPINVVITGDENVGKSCILQRIKNNTFSDMYISTIGVDFGNVDINKNHLQIWDTAGQERFRKNSQSYYRDADVILYVYDLTNQKSFDYLNNHIADVKKFCPVNVVQYLVATKSDKPEYGATRSDIDTLVAKFNLKGDYQVSSKSGESVQNMFHDMVEKYEPETSVVDDLLGKPEMTLVDELLVELSELSKKVDSITERLKTLKQ